MCGITGIFNYQTGQEVNTTLLSGMCGSITHRGPDEEGFFSDQETGIALGHKRLSIIDIKTGKQPMANVDETIWIVFNGEIYNFPELKKELQGKGYNFRTTSDTEVIIYMYEEYGEEGFARLNGIFAFAIYDKRKRCVILARDHFGVKPLYYTFANGSLLFGSEMKAILQAPFVKKELDYDAFNSFLTFRYNPSPQTLFKGLKKLQPGHNLQVTTKGNVKLKSFWDYVPKTNNHISENETVEEYQRLFSNAVYRQMISDVPVGLLLSGGVDSAVIGYLMQENTSEKIKSFTIGFLGKGDFNELDVARITAKRIGSEHYDLTITQKEYLDFFYKSFWYTEEPIAESAIPALYYVSKLASQHLKVVLGGQGADEPLAGYPRYIGAHYICKYASVLQKLPLNTISSLLPRNERLKRAAYANRFSNELQRFLGTYTIFTPLQKEYLVLPEVKKRLHNVDEALVESFYSQTSMLDDSLSKILFIDTRMSLSDNLLLFNDKMTMANSLEMRVPFLDIEFVKFIESLPSKLKLNGLSRKYIHKKAVEKWLPKEIIYRKKRGFSTPMDEWLQKDFAKTAKKSFLTKKDSACRKYFNLNFINGLIDQHQNRKENFKRHIFLLLSFELWHKTFFENKKIESEILQRENQHS